MTLLAMPGPAAADFSYDTLTAIGRPTQFYQFGNMQGVNSDRVCVDLLAELNSPLPMRSYDLKPILLGTPSSIAWKEEVVSRERHRFIGTVKTAKVNLLGQQDVLELLLHTLDVKDGPIDGLYVLPQRTLDTVRLSDGRIDASLLIPVMRSSKSDDAQITPKAEWISAHQSHMDPDQSTTFGADYYWSDVLTIRNSPYVLIASPPQFDPMLNFYGYMDIFLAPLLKNGAGEAVCHLVHATDVH